MLLVLALATGCYVENLPQVDIKGRVVLPAAAATRDVPVFDADGNVVGTESVEDPRLIGPVFLGAYPGIDTISFPYPHPVMGPIITEATPGDTYPYGGTSVGRFDFACYQALACKVVTGRFNSYDDVLDYFANLMGTPVTDEHGSEVIASDVFQQECYDYYKITSDQELTFLGSDQFVKQDDGTYAADYNMAHTTLVEGMTLWGFMDAPRIFEYVAGGSYQASENGSFTTCNEALGNNHVEYDQDFYEGAPQGDILNFPSFYIQKDDWVADGLTVVMAEDETPTITLSVKVEE